MPFEIRNGWVGFVERGGCSRTELRADSLVVLSDDYAHDGVVVYHGRYQIDADPATPLLYVLRDELALNGAKYGCGLGQCGSCTVVVDGEAVLSCMVPIMLLEGREITTIEGLGTIDAPGPLQEAFIELQAAQCGYCIPGMMMSAHALLRRNAQPSEEDIREALATNLCRCGTHMRILAAIRRAGELMQAASLRATDQGRAG